MSRIGHGGPKPVVSQFLAFGKLNGLDRFGEHTACAIRLERCREGDWCTVSLSGNELALHVIRRWQSIDLIRLVDDLDHLLVGRGIFTVFRFVWTVSR